MVGGGSICCIIKMTKDNDYYISVYISVMRWIVSLYSCCKDSSKCTGFDFCTLIFDYIVFLFVVLLLQLYKVLASLISHKLIPLH